MVGEVALGQVFVRVLRFFLVVKLHQCPTLVFIYMLLLKRITNEQSLGTFQKAMYFQKWRSVALKSV